MKVMDPPLGGLKLIQLDIYQDDRGFFIERFHLNHFRELGLPTQFVQDNHSRSLPGVLRGLHYQLSEPQGKLVGVLSGRIWDVVVDLRSYSPTFGQVYGVELNDENQLLFWIPPGFAHGFCNVGDGPADVIYKVDKSYNPSSESGICWNDAVLKILWPIKNPIVSKKDQNLPSFEDYRTNPVF